MDAHKTPLALRGTVVCCRDDPALTDPRTALLHEPDGVVLCRDGLIEAVGPASQLLPTLPAEIRITHYPGCLIAPGFIDLHVHYPQTAIIASRAERLPDWLDRHAYVAEQAFADPGHARAVARVFCEELLRNGTTSALVFCTVHPQSVDALFTEAATRNMRLIAGKVLMDRHAPAGLRDTAQSGHDDSQALIAKWHGRGRALYAITPRFAPTSSSGQLELAGALRKEHPDVFMHSHIAESREELARVQKLFPGFDGYLDVYHRHGLTGRRAVFAHGIHLTEAEWRLCHATGTAIAHCPTSNLFLGSGLFRMDIAKDPRRPVHVGLGTDIGAGTSFSLLSTLGEAYKVARLAGVSIGAGGYFHLATLGAARALALDHRIGTLRPGHEADLVVLDPCATPLMSFRSRRAESIEDLLFILMTLGDDRAVKATYIAGELAHRRD